MKYIFQGSILTALLAVALLGVPHSAQAEAEKITAGQTLRCLISPWIFLMDTPGYCFETPRQAEPAAYLTEPVNPSAAARVADGRTATAALPAAVAVKPVTAAPIAPVTTVTGGITRAELNASLLGLRKELLDILPASTVTYAAAPSAPAYTVYHDLASTGYVDGKISGLSGSLNSRVDTLAASLAEATGTPSWRFNGGALYYSGGNVGIGSTTPADTLTVAGESLGLYDTDGLMRAKLSAKPGEAAFLTLVNAEGLSATLQTGDGYLESLQAFYIRNNGEGNAALSVNGAPAQTAPLIEAVQGASTLFVIKPDGKVGIGTGTPASTLDVWGGFRVGTSSIPTLFVDTSLSGNGRVGIGTSTPGRNLTVSGSMSVYRSGATPHIEIIQGAAGADLKNWRLSAETDGSFTFYPMTDSNSNLRPLRYTHDGRLVITSAAGSNADARLYVDSGNAASSSAVFLGGNVGIGTSTPAAALDTAGIIRAVSGAYSLPSAGKGLLSYYDSGADQGVILPYDSGGSAYKPLVIQAAPVRINTGYAAAALGIGLGMTDPKAELDMSGYFRTVGATVDTGNVPTAGKGLEIGYESHVTRKIGHIRSYDRDTGTSTKLYLDGSIVALNSESGGFVGIGTNAPTANLHASGTIRFSSFGAGTLTTDASGNLTVSSDERLKDVRGEFTSSLESIRKIRPIVYQWKPETGYDASSTYAGFSAQNVQAAIPEAVSTDARGFLSLSDRPILATLVNAVRDIAGKLDGFAEYFYARVLESKSVRTDELCVKKADGTSACFTGDQLEAAVSASGGTATPPAPQSIPDSSDNSAPANPAPEEITETPSPSEPAPAAEAPASDPAPAPAGETAEGN